MTRPIYRKCLAIVILALLLSACGKKGPLVYPETTLPAPIATLGVEQKGDVFFITWSPPAKEVNGKALKELGGFRIFRRDVLPPGEDCEECPAAYRVIRTVDLEYLQDVRFYNNIYVCADRETENGKSYQYKIVSFKMDGSESAPSNKVRRKKVAAPPAPRLKAIAAPTGIILEWETPQGVSDVAYNIYRRRADQISSLVILNSTPVRENRFEDLGLARGVKYIYTVRGVADAVEGALSNEAATELAKPE